MEFLFRTRIRWDEAARRAGAAGDGWVSVRAVCPLDESVGIRSGSAENNRKLASEGFAVIIGTGTSN